MDIASISTLVATGAILTGVALTYLEVRSLVRTRKTELYHGIFSSANSMEFYRAWEKFRESESGLGFEDYKRKYGLAEWNLNSNTLAEISFLLNEKLIDIDAVHKIFGNAEKITWEKMKHYLEDVKKENPQETWSIEYLYNEMKKGEQTLTQQ